VFCVFPFRSPAGGSLGEALLCTSLNLHVVPVSIGPHGGVNRLELGQIPSSTLSPVHALLSGLDRGGL
jgi:hypothetical protein